MTKLKKSIITILLAVFTLSLTFGLTGCLTNLAKKLEMPLNLELEIRQRTNGTEYFINWDPVEGAESYTVQVGGGAIIPAYTTRLDITDYVTPGVAVRVNLRAIGNQVSTSDSELNKAYVRVEQVSNVILYHLSEDETYYSVTCFAIDKENLGGRLVFPDFYMDLPIKEIGENAFLLEGGKNPVTGAGCNTYTTGFRLPKYLEKVGNAAFAYCTTVKNIELPAGVTYIGNNAFYGCTRLTSVNTQNITHFGQSAFGLCKALTSVNLDNAEYLGSNLLQGSSLVPENPTDKETLIGDNVLYTFNDKEATEYVLPTTITKVAGGAFAGLDKLEKVTLHDNVKILGDSLFMNCVSLKEVTLPSTLEAIPDTTFAYCQRLDLTTLPSTVKSIGYGAFFGAYVPNLELNEGLETIGDLAFAKSTIVAANFPSTVKSVGENAYAESGLTTLTLNQGLESIGLQAFYKTTISEVTIPGTVTFLGNGLFIDCVALQTVILEEGITSIPKYAFAQLSLPVNIVIPTSVETISVQCLAGTMSASILYAGDVDSYAAIKRVDLFNEPGQGTMNDPSLGFNIARVYYYQEDEPEIGSNGNYVGRFWRYVDSIPTIWAVEKEG